MCCCLFLCVCLFPFSRRKRDTNTTKSWPSLARQRNAIKMAFFLVCNAGPTLLGGFVIFQGIGIRIAKEPFIFVIFLGVSGPPVHQSGSALWSSKI